MAIRFSIRTPGRSALVEITSQINRIVADSGIMEGTVVVYVPHTTAAVTVQENADPDVVHDLLLWLTQLIPKDATGFRHAEGNSDAHLKAALVGSSVTLIVSEGRLILGTWQGVYFCEFDGPRTRDVVVQLIRG